MSLVWLKEKKSLIGTNRNSRIKDVWMNTSWNLEKWFIESDYWDSVFSVVNLSRLVLLGNHRDAWTYGAVDPNSGTAALLEVISFVWPICLNWMVWQVLRSRKDFLVGCTAPGEAAGERMETTTNNCLLQLGCWRIWLGLSPFHFALCVCVDMKLIDL